MIGSPAWSTATQKDVDTHETPSTKAPDPSVAGVCQEPLYSTNALLVPPLRPTPMQNELDVHDMLASPFVVVAVVVQLVPSKIDAPPPVAPAAQNVVEVQETVNTLNPQVIGWADDHNEPSY